MCTVQYIWVTLEDRDQGIKAQQHGLLSVLSKLVGCPSKKLYEVWLNLKEFGTKKLVDSSRNLVSLAAPQRSWLHSSDPEA